MERNCDMIQDLLPLYADGCCREGSKTLVEEHLAACPDCQRVFQQMTGQLPLEEELPEPEAAPAEKVLKKGMKKVRRRWAVSILVAVLAVALLIPLAVLGWNEFSLQGVCYTNLDDLWTARRFMAALQEGDYEKAYSYTDWEALREFWREKWGFSDELMADFEQDGLRFFLEGAQALRDAGGIADFRFSSVSAVNSEHDSYVVRFFATIDGETYEIQLGTSNGKISTIGGNLWRAYGRGSAADILDTAIALWSHNLWAYYDSQTKAGQ